MAATLERSRPLGRKPFCAALDAVVSPRVRSCRIAPHGDPVCPSLWSRSRADLYQGLSRSAELVSRLKRSCLEWPLRQPPACRCRLTPRPYRQACRPAAALLLSIPPTPPNRGLSLNRTDEDGVIFGMKPTLTTCLLLLAAAPLSSPAQPPDAFQQNRQLGRGVNILGYDPIWRNRDQARFQEKHFRLLREAGFQSVRINLHPFRHMDRDHHWALRPAWWSTLDWAIQHATNQGLRVILDLHEFNAIGEDPEGTKERFLAFWRQVAARGTPWSDSVLFELLNEPCKKLTPQLWNQWLREALAIIRPHHPHRTIIIGPAFWNSVDHLHELDLPPADRHIIVTVHYYKPMAFTHQGAAWTGQQDKVGIDWRGTEEEVAAIRRDFDKVAAWARDQGRPIFLGEFGAYDRAPMDARVRYIRTVAREAEARGWSWAYWQFDSDFILWDMQRDTWVRPILEALIPEAAKR